MVLRELLNNKKIVLASASPRRHELLAGLDIEFTIDSSSNTKEEIDPLIENEGIPLYLASLKSSSFHRQLNSDEILITADTIVICNGKVLGKPKDREDAFYMLKTLSGMTHTVVTGVCIRDLNKKDTFSAFSKVTFKELSDNEINYYIDHYKPYDKAGSYGVQEWIGYIAITSIEGSFYNVMGLPVQKVYSHLISFISE